MDLCDNTGRTTGSCHDVRKSVYRTGPFGVGRWRFSFVNCLGRLRLRVLRKGGLCFGFSLGLGVVFGEGLLEGGCRSSYERIVANSLSNSGPEAIKLSVGGKVERGKRWRSWRRGT